MKKKSISVQSILLLCIAMVLGFSGTGLAVYDKNSPGAQSTVKNAKDKKPSYKEGELIVKFKVGLSDQKKKEKHTKHRGKLLKKFRHQNLEHIQLAPDMSVEEAIAEYKADPDVEYAEPNYFVHAQQEVLPIDPFFPKLWGMKNTGQTGGTAGADIHATEAWEKSKGNGDGSVVIGVTDTGIDYDHEDLCGEKDSNGVCLGNIWTNPGEIPGNGLDDDNNGYIDDVHGINTIADKTSIDAGDPMDDNGHGTHCAGTIGAIGNNNIGVVGVNWHVKIASCKFLDASGRGLSSDAVECMDYFESLKDKGVNLVGTSNSWGGGGYSQSEYDAIQSHMDKGMLFIAAAGNDSYDNDRYDSYPSNYDLPNVIAVAATDHNDSLASFSQWGHRKVDVGAPGVDIASLRAPGTFLNIPENFIPADAPEARYIYLSGTSMATPHVAGLAALLKADTPTRTWSQIRNLILTGGDSIPALEGITVTGKRINAFGSLTCTNRTLFDPMILPDNDFQVGVSKSLTVMSVNCADSAPLTNFQVRKADGTSLVFVDDGSLSDMIAGDGVFTAAWIPDHAKETLTYFYPDGKQEVYSVYNLKIKTTGLPTGTIYTPYHAILEHTGGTAPHSWSITAGTLPVGVRLDSGTGELSGTPTEKIGRAHV